MIIFKNSPNKLWPGAQKDIVLKRMNQSLKLGKRTYREVDYDSRIASVRPHFVNPFKHRFGPYRTHFAELKFLIQAMEDHLTHTTFLGNFWQLARYLILLISLVFVIVFSGGLSESRRVVDVVQVVGMWTICEFSFVKSILASSRFYELRNRLGINLKKITLAAFCTTWIETCALILFVSLVSFVTQGAFLGVWELLHTVIGILLLMIFLCPIAYFIGLKSSKWTDARFLIGPSFRLLLVFTPLFSKYHQEIGIFATISKYMPSNLAFVGVLDNVKISVYAVETYIILVCLTSLLWLKKERIKLNTVWIEE